tara:strand:- start:713 stop:961 length:249 start_codon:yes stop_codon:yes gene_type:complete
MKELMKEIRRYLSLKLLELSFDLMPNSKFKIDLAKFILEDKFGGVDEEYHHCQSEIEGGKTCGSQCRHCEEYYKPLNNKNDE